MQLIPLLHVDLTPFVVGGVLPWNVRDGAGRLLLSKGHALPTQALVDRLSTRGAYVDADEHQVRLTRPERREDAATAFFQQLEIMEHTLHALFCQPSLPRFNTGLTEVAGALAKMAANHPDPLIYSVIRMRHDADERPFVRHSLRAAALCAIVGRKTGWSPAQQLTLVCAALTMDISMVANSLEGARATVSLYDHPLRSAELLERMDIKDPLLLRVVAEHHEKPRGAGYPKKVAMPHEMARLLFCVDTYLDKQRLRIGSENWTPKEAAKDLYQQAPGDPMASLLIKEFGAYPPGCCVQLKNGEIGIVVRRGLTAMTPVVRVETRSEATGFRYAEGCIRDTAQPAYAITGAVRQGSPEADEPRIRLGCESQAGRDPRANARRGA